MPRSPEYERIHEDAETALDPATGAWQRGGPDFGEAASEPRDDTSFLEKPASSAYAQAFHYACIGGIFAATTLTIVETMPELRAYTAAFTVCDYCVTAVFSIELAIRFFAADSPLAFCANCYNVIDLLAVCPGYAELWLSVATEGGAQQVHDVVGSMRTLRMIRVLRLVRVVRVVSEWSYARQVCLFFRITWQIAQTGLWLVVTLLGAMMLLGATLIYCLEAPPCVERGSTGHPTIAPAATGKEVAAVVLGCAVGGPFESIPASVWWAIQTLTTVGYGDAVPTTAMGKVVGGLVCFSGTMIIAVTAAQFSLSFQQQWQHERAKADFEERITSELSVPTESMEIAGLLEDVQFCWEALIHKVTSASIDAGGGVTPPCVSPLLSSIKEQGSGLHAGMSAFIYEALAESLLPRRAAGGRRASVLAPPPACEQEPPRPVAPPQAACAEAQAVAEEAAPPGRRGSQSVTFRDPPRALPLASRSPERLATM